MANSKKFNSKLVKYSTEVKEGTQVNIKDNIFYTHFLNLHNLFPVIEKDFIDFYIKDEVVDELVEKKKTFYLNCLKEDFLKEGLINEDFLKEISNPMDDFYELKVLNDLDFFDFDFFNSYISEDLNMNVTDFVFELYDCKDLNEIKENNIYTALNSFHAIFHSNKFFIDKIKKTNLDSEILEYKKFLVTFLLEEKFSKVFYLSLWANKSNWIFSLNSFLAGERKSKPSKNQSLKKKVYFEKYIKNIKEFKLDEIEHYYDYLRLSLQKDCGNSEVKKMDISMYSLNKDLSFLNNANFFKNFFFSDFIFDLSRNLTVKQETEFNNHIFFPSLNFFKKFNLLNFKTIDWKTGFSSKDTNIEVLSYRSANFYSDVFSFDFIFKYSLSFLFMFFIPFLCYSLFEVGVILYIACYFFSWSIPEYFFEIFIFKLLKFLLLFFLGEVQYQNILEFFYQPIPVFFWLSQRMQFFIFFIIVTTIICWFFCFIFYVFANFFFFL
jgi:hypothetical protein